MGLGWLEDRPLKPEPILSPTIDHLGWLKGRDISYQASVSKSELEEAQWETADAMGRGGAWSRGLTCWQGRGRWGGLRTRVSGAAKLGVTRSLGKTTATLQK